jgi:hypothetical protein
MLQCRTAKYDKFFYSVIFVRKHEINILVKNKFLEIVLPSNLVPVTQKYRQSIYFDVLYLIPVSDCVGKIEEIR